MGQLISRLKKKKDEQPQPPPPRPPRQPRTETPQERARREYERLERQYQTPPVDYQRELQYQQNVAEARSSMLRRGDPNIKKTIVNQTIAMLKQNEITNLSNRGIPHLLARNIVESAPSRSLTSRRYRQEPLQTPAIRREITQAEIRGMDVPLETALPTQEETRQQQLLGTTPRPSMQYKKGGLVKKTGLALVHKGELVVPAQRVKAVDKAVKKAGLKPLKK
jgi:hypothetical protein